MSTMKNVYYSFSILEIFGAVFGIWLIFEAVLGIEHLPPVIDFDKK